MYLGIRAELIRGDEAVTDILLRGVGMGEASEFVVEGGGRHRSGVTRHVFIPGSCQAICRPRSAGG